MKFTNGTRGIVEFCHAGQTLVCPPGVEVECPSSLFAELMKYPAVKGYFDLGLFVLTVAEAPSPEVPQAPAEEPLKHEDKQEKHADQPKPQPVPRKRKQSQVNS